MVPPLPELLGSVGALVGARLASLNIDVGAVKGALALLGLLAAARTLWGAACFSRGYFRRRGRDPKSFGSWAVVTGATDGIGKAFSKLLAQKGAA